METITVYLQIFEKEVTSLSGSGHFYKQMPKNTPSYSMNIRTSVYSDNLKKMEYTKLPIG